MKPEGSVVCSWRVLKVNVRTSFSWQMTGEVGREKRLDLPFKRITLIAFRGITVGWVGEETGK